MKKPGIEEIYGNRNFHLMHKLHYDSIIAFVFKNIKLKTLGSGLYFLSLILLFILIMIFSIKGFISHQISVSKYISSLFYGFLSGSFIVIPFHELFHALAYRLIGARPQFGMDLKQLIFYITADKFVVNRREFHWIALAPFIIINVSVASVFVFLNINQQIIALFFLFFHNIMCIGDFAMLSFYHHHSEKKLFSFDIIEEKTSYMFEYIERNNI
ncbi:MAG: DUF3267 domain-containing protein [Bacteroidales bacterium]|nr:DUF3267 domain-containing protein [Bacteroidales bacterium]MCF8389260.1 DUF3267 domain-containing protein [Bacteroidales bacterium]